MKIKSNIVKSISSAVLIGLNVLTLLSGGLALAQLRGNIGSSETGIERVGPGTVGDLVKLLGAVVRWAYIIFFVLAVLLILWAALNYLLAAGSEERAKKAKNGLIYAAIAIAIAFLAVGFEQIIGTFLVAPGR